nr:DNA-formamidopyrimidine glycosylase family protein [Woeseiaceae bacterium]
MPEGDTIHKIANYLEPRLANTEVVSVQMADALAARRCESQRVDAVTARGKHLFIELDNGFALRSHLGMHGSWHCYPKGGDWQRPRWQASLIVSTAADDYVCFNAKEVELVRIPSVRERIVSARLGPDLIADEVDFEMLPRRVREFLAPDDLLCDALLDQRITAGIGNVYKSEVLFIERLSPFSELADVSDRDIRRCFETAADRLGRNLGGGRRVTRLEKDGAGRLWVYNRHGKPCIECDTPIRNQ